MKNIKNINKLVAECVRLHKIIEDAKASSKAASQSFTNAFIALAKDFGLTGENRSEFYSLFSDMKTDKKLSSRVKTAATRFIQYIELTGKQPTVETGLPQKGYGSLKEYASQPEKSNKKADVQAEILPELQIIELFSSLSNNLQKEVLTKLQAIVKPVKAKPKKA